MGPLAASWPTVIGTSLRGRPPRRRVSRHDGFLEYLVSTANEVKPLIGPSGRSASPMTVAVDWCGPT